MKPLVRLMINQNDPDDLNGLAVLIFIPKGVGHQQQVMPFHQAEGLPALRATLDAVLLREDEGFINNLD
ncbi:MAG: hypothetical protein ACYDHM_12030 [Acidiferrobacterales bacterium]